MEDLKVGHRYLVREDYVSRSIDEVKIVDMSSRHFKIQFESGSTRWVVREKPFYKVIEDLGETDFSSKRPKIMNPDPLEDTRQCGQQKAHISPDVKSLSGEMTFRPESLKETIDLYDMEHKLAREKEKEQMQARVEAEKRDCNCK